MKATEAILIRNSVFHPQDSASSILVKALAWAGIFLAPLQGILISVFVLIVADFITGVIAAKKAGEKITSNRMTDTLLKLFLYELAVIVSLSVETNLLPLIPLVKIVGGFVGLIEVKSFFENISRITKQDSLWKYLRNYIKQRFKTELDAVVQEKESQNP